MEQELTKLSEILNAVHGGGVTPIYSFILGVWYDRNDLNENSINILRYYHQKRSEIQLTQEIDIQFHYHLMVRNFGEVDRILGISNTYPQVSFAQYFPELLQVKKSPAEMNSQGPIEYNQEIQQPREAEGYKYQPREGEEFQSQRIEAEDYKYQPREAEGYKYQPIESEEYKYNAEQMRQSRVQEIDQKNKYQVGYEDQSLNRRNMSTYCKGDRVKSADQDSNPGNITRYASESETKEEVKIICKDERHSHNLSAPLNIEYIPTPQGPPVDQARCSSSQDKSLELVKEAVALESLEPSKLKEIFNQSNPRIDHNLQEARAQSESTYIKEDKSYLDKTKPAGVEDIIRKNVKHGDSYQSRVIMDKSLNLSAEIPRKIQHEIFYSCEECSRDSPISDMIRLKECGHYYHIDCIRNIALHTLSKNQIPGACPSRTCRQEIDSDDILRILPPEHHERYSELVAISISSEHYICPKCNKEFIKPENLSYIRCPKCLTYICKECKLQEHYGKPCMQASKLNQLKADTQSHGTRSYRRKCPSCNLEDHPGYTCQEFRKYKYRY